MPDPKSLDNNLMYMIWIMRMLPVEVPTDSKGAQLHKIAC